MLIKRTKKRIAAKGAHEFFLDKNDLWLALRKGEEIEIPEDQFDSIKLIFEDSIEIVKKRIAKIKDIKTTLGVESGGE